MKTGDIVRASFPYGGVPACEGKIIKELVLGNKKTQFLVSFEVRPNVFKQFYLTERELTSLTPKATLPVTTPVSSLGSSTINNTTTDSESNGLVVS